MTSLTQNELEQKIIALSQLTNIIRDVRGGFELERFQAATVFREEIEIIVQAGASAVPMLVLYLEDPQLGVAVRRILASLSLLESFNVLFETIFSSNLAVSEDALFVIREFNLSNELLPVLVKSYELSNQDRAKCALLPLLLNPQNPQRLSIAESILRSSNVTLCQSVVRELIKRPSSQIGDLLKLALQKKDTQVRIESIIGMVLTGERDRFQELVQAFQSRSIAVRIQVLLALARLGLPEGVELIAQGLEDLDVLVRSAALLAVPYCGDPKLVALMAQSLEASQPEIYEQAQAVFFDVTGQVPPANRHDAQSLALQVAVSMKSGKRYFRGKPWFPLNIVERLIDPIASHNHYLNLVSATGESFDFDPDRDLINNLDAIKRWKCWASKQKNYMSGNWYYLGDRIQ